MRRVRVAVRPKMRGQRARRRAAVVAVLGLGVLAVAAARRAKNELAGASLKDKLMPRATAVSGAPGALEAPIEDFLKSGATAEELLGKFPSLASARLRRDFLTRAARFEVEPRRAIAAVERGGRVCAYLSDDGVVFDAPAGAYSVAAPVIEPKNADAEELKRLAAFLPLAQKPEELPAPLARVSYLSPQDGWDVRLDDGTRLLWGALKFAPQKFARLREVMLDAKARDGEQKLRTMEADLRYFEDGKILLRPWPSKT